MTTSITSTSSNGNRNVQYHHHRRGHSFNGIPNLVNSNTHRHRTLSFASSNLVSQKLGTLFAESEELATSGFDDLLSSTDGEKHDYDWLLTPPRSPDFPAPRSEPQPVLVPTRSSLGKPTSRVSANKNGECRAGSGTRSASSCRKNKSYSSSRASSSSILNTRPSSQIPRPHILQSPHAATAARPCTPTHRHSTPPSSSRASTPSRRRPQPVVPPNFPLETPPNLRTTLPADRAVSAGRSRPTLKASPLVNTTARRSLIKPPSSAATDSTGLGIGSTISKKSRDMAIRHMDIRSSSGSLRSLSSATLFPQSIRTSAPKTQPRVLRSASASVNMNGGLQLQVPTGYNVNDGMKNRREKKINERQHLARLDEVDTYQSCRYEALLLKNEDLNSSDWLHSAQHDKCDQGPIFDNGFQSLPEPFGLL